MQLRAIQNCYKSLKTQPLVVPKTLRVFKKVFLFFAGTTTNDNSASACKASIRAATNAIITEFMSTRIRTSTRTNRTIKANSA